MTIFLLIVVLILGCGLVVTYLLKRRIEKTADAARQEALNAKQHRDTDVAQARADANAAITYAQAAYEQKVGELEAEADTTTTEHSNKKSETHSVSSISTVKHSEMHAFCLVT